MSFNFICMLGCCSFCIVFNIFRVFGELEVWRVRLFPLVNVAFRREIKKMEKINSTSTSTDFFFSVFLLDKISKKKQLYFLLFILLLLKIYLLNGIGFDKNNCTDGKKIKKNKKNRDERGQVPRKD